MSLSYNRDVKVLSLGKEFNRLVALARGDIHGTTSQTPNSRLLTLGFRVLADLPSWDVHFPYMVAVVQGSFLQENRDTARAFLKALCEATSFYKDEAHKHESLTIIGRYIHHADLKGAAEERYAVGGPGLLSYPPYPTAEGFQTVIEFLEAPKAQQVKLDHLIDTRLLDELQADGNCTNDNAPRGHQLTRTIEEPTR
jgi:ABC-type nitrate/sulfonate/bicarbonate transport system substrate-binding protein